MQAPFSETSVALKLRLLQHCGIDPQQEARFDLALGYAALTDTLSWASHDVGGGDVLLLYLRGGDDPAAVRARERAATGLRRLG